MSRAEHVGLMTLGLGSLAVLFVLVLLKVTTFTAMSNSMLLTPLAVPAMVAWGLVVGRLWDRVLRGRNVTLVDGPKPSRDDPYRVIKRPYVGLAIFGMLYMSSGCAMAYRATYVAGAITKEEVTQAHGRYSQNFDKRWNNCDPRVNRESKVRTLDDMNACLGEDFDQEAINKVLTAMAAYRAAATTLSAVLLQTDPSKEALGKAWKDAFDAAVDLLEVLPDGAERLEKLKGLLGRMTPS